MPDRNGGDAVVLLAGGAATRFAGKLESNAGGEPLVLRVYRALRATGIPAYVAGKGSFSPAIDAALDCPMLVDRWPGRGPLCALLSACGEIRHARVFAAAADMPNLDASVYASLAAAWRDGDDAAIPTHDGRLEPLAGLYSRAAVLREGFALLDARAASMHALLDRLRVRAVPLPARLFANVNRPSDLAEVR